VQAYLKSGGFVVDSLDGSRTLLELEYAVSAVMIAPGIVMVPWNERELIVSMTLIGLRAFKVHLSTMIDQVMQGEFVTITRHDRPVAVVVPVEAARIAREAMASKRGSLVSCLRRFPGGGPVLRNSSASRDISL